MPLGYLHYDHCAIPLLHPLLHTFSLFLPHSSHASSHIRLSSLSLSIRLISRFSLYPSPHDALSFSQIRSHEIKVFCHWVFSSGQSTISNSVFFPLKIFYKALIVFFCIGFLLISFFFLILWGILQVHGQEASKLWLSCIQICYSFGYSFLVFLHLQVENVQENAR